MLDARHASPDLTTPLAPGSPAAGGPRGRSLLEASSASPGTIKRQRDSAASLRQLRERLRAAGVLAPCPWLYARKLAELGVLWAMSVAALVVLRDSWWVVAAGPLWALATGQTVLLAHDAVHGAAFSTHPALARLARLALPHALIGALAGGSSSWWRQSHNAHHALSNDPALDPDIDYPFLAFDLAQARTKARRYRAILRHQHVLVWFMLPLVSVTMRVYSVAYLVRQLLDARERRSRHWLEAAALLAHWVAYGALVAQLSPGRALAFVALHQACFGTYLALITATNHWAMPMPDAAQLTFVEHQIVTSRNIRGGRLVRFLYGGLDTQIEHHLFSTLPRTRLEQARPLVRAYCREHGIAYQEASPGEALRDIFVEMRAVAHAMRDART